MSVYYVTHPNIDLSAKITAPSTEKARTTFLDYLERVGKLKRSKRGYLRQNMVAEKMSDAFSVESDIELSYGSVGQQAFGEPVSSFDEVLDEVSAPRRNDKVLYEREPESEEFAEPELQPQPMPQPQRLSPIAQMSLGRHA